MFKSILMFAIFAAVSAHMAHYREECKDELNIPQESIDNFKNWKFENDDHSACYIECIFKKMGLVNDGQFNVDVIAEKLSSEDKTAEELKPDIESCIDNTITDSCKRIFKGFACFKENNLYRIKASAQSS
ncbi:unnamed protein product [Chironomus riparius]|uniref:Uncharacterized protein n=1 Tax=Chironomus riparius TaxID=315576 RepID=A0A9N9WW38_9DIPT|nr:unnamed protein product [Chironomus riparius]